MINKIDVTVTLAGADGSASGNADTRVQVNGRLIGVYVNPGSQPNTLDVTIKATQPDMTMLTLTNVSAAAWDFPRVLVQGNTGADLTAVYDTYPVDGYINVAGAQGNAGTFTAYLVLES